jgi:class 3 adenylate cyclase
VARSATSEVRDSAAGYLGEKVLLDITESLKDLALSGDHSQREAALSILERRVSAGLLSNRDGTSEFLFRILRGEHAPSRRSAALILWKMGDDDSPQVVGDFLTTGTEAQTVEVLHRLRGTLREPILPAVCRLLPRGSASVQEALRDLLLDAEEPALRETVLAAVLRMRDTAMEEDPVAGDEPPVVDLRMERTSFRFEREHIQELVILFSDIQGYSKKAQLLTPMQLSTLIQEYETLLLAQVDDHRGVLVKRMGDGHMIVFEKPLDAVLAAIRIQKSMVRFNRYRDENSRVVIRVGIHAGKVVRKQGGDVLGNDVNIASRLESSARPGSILISDSVHEKVKDSIHAREIGRITVKNITEPIRVFEPYEIVLDLPAELDPLKQRRSDRPPGGPDAVPAPSPSAATAVSGTVSVDIESWRELEKCFSALAAASTPSAASGMMVASVARQVVARWKRIRARTAAGAGEAASPAAMAHSTL